MKLLIMEVVYTGAFLFLIGIYGIIYRCKSLIHMLISLELILLGSNLILISISISNDDLMGNLLALLVLGIAGAESAIGLAIIIVYYRKKGVLVIHRAIT